MILKNFSFSIDHHGDGSARLQLHHGGDNLTMDLTSAQRQALGLSILDPFNADRVFDETQDGEAS